MTNPVKILNGPGVVTMIIWTSYIEAAFHIESDCTINWGLDILWKSGWNEKSLFADPLDYGFNFESVLQAD